MHKFTKAHRDESMTNLVSFHNVPMRRGLAFAINHIEEHGAKVSIFSADRTVEAIAEHNKQFGTNLHAQKYLYDNQNRPGFNPANPPWLTSHCYYSDGNPAYGRGRGEKIPWYMLGIDMSDWGMSEDVRRFRTTAAKLGYRVTQPYASGSERHHIIFSTSPIKNLENWNVIAKERG
jgi:hypothetical protein